MPARAIVFLREELHVSKAAGGVIRWRMIAANVKRRDSRTSARCAVFIHAEQILIPVKFEIGEAAICQCDADVIVLYFTGSNDNPFIG